MADLGPTNSSIRFLSANWASGNQDAEGKSGKGSTRAFVATCDATDGRKIIVS